MNKTFVIVVFNKCRYMPKSKLLTYLLNTKMIYTVAPHHLFTCANLRKKHSL